MATYAISDIHGNLKALESILRQIDLTPSDELYVLGDVIDRQPHGIEILRQLMKMPNVHMTIGNHEYMMLQAIDPTFDNPTWEMLDKHDQKKIWYQMIDQWYENGGLVTHEDFIMINMHEQQKIVDFLKSLPTEYRITIGNQEFILCHGCPSFVYEEMYDAFPHIRQSTRTEFAVWDRDFIFTFADTWSGVITIAGHTPTVTLNSVDQIADHDARIYHNGNLYIIDCGAAFAEGDGLDPFRLACIRLDDMKVFYS